MNVSSILGFCVRRYLSIPSIVLLVYLYLKNANVTLAPNDFDGLDEVIASTDYTFRCLDENDVTRCRVVAKCKTAGNGKAKWMFDIPDEVFLSFSFMQSFFYCF